VHATRFLNNIH